MKKGSFWSPFLFFFGGIALAALAIGGWVFVRYVQSDNPASVIQGHDFAHDPFSRPLIPYSDITNYDSTQAPPALRNGFLYQDAMVNGFGAWGWHASGVWASTEQVAEGAYSLKVSYDQPFGSFGASGFSTLLSTSTQSLSLMVYPDAEVSDVRVLLFDEQGHALREQSLGWYTLNGKLLPGVWQKVTIPISNLISSSTLGITGFGFAGSATGTAYFDAVQFSPQTISVAPWVPKVDDVGEGVYDPLATSTQFSLPYTMKMGPGGLVGWHTFFGRLAMSRSWLSVGPAQGSNTDSLSVFRSGKLWQDYQIDTTLDWGETSVFSLIMRFVNDRNYLSCAYSHYGETVQIYQMKDGVSTMIAQSPGLSIPFYSPWEHVSLTGQVYGNTVACFLDGEKVLTANATGAPSTGSAGIEAYDQNPFASPHHVHEFRVRGIRVE